MQKRFVLVGCLIAVWEMSSALVSAAPPQITAVTPRGWKAGANDIAITGANFTEKTRLVVDVPGAAVTPKAGVKFASNQLQFDVHLPVGTLGPYQVRLASEEGLSKPEMVLVDALATVAEKEPNNDAAQAQVVELPAGVEGRLSGAEADVFAFNGKKGQRVVVEIAGRRLGANIKPVLRLFNDRGLDIELAQPARRFGSDSRLIATLPDDGRYHVELIDLVYRGDNKQYRLLIGDLQTADSVFPLGGKYGEKVAFQLSAGAAAKVVPAPLTLPANRGISHQPLAVVGEAGRPLSPFPLVLAVGQHPEVIETKADKVQALAVPVVVNGRLSSKGEQDEYQAAVKPGDKLRIFVEADRLGSPLDGIIEIRDEKGKVLSTQDDGPGTADPDFIYQVPANVMGLSIVLRDAYGRGGDPFNYRLGIEPAAEGDFQLVLLDPLVNIPAGGSASVRVRATRRDYQGPIRLKLLGDVARGLKVAGAEIPAGGTETFVSLTMPAGGETLQAGSVQIVGEAGPAEKPMLVRAARIDTTTDPAYEGSPWLESRLPASVTSPGLFTLEFEPQEVALLKGLPYIVKVKVRRAADQTGPIKLTLQTTLSAQQQAQLKVLPNQTVAEKADEATFRLEVPANATENPLSLLLKGELLDVKTKKTVLGSAEAVALPTRITAPFAVDVPAIKLLPGVRQVVPIKITRLGSFREPIQLVLAGIPTNFRSGPTALTAAGDSAVVNVPLVAPLNQKLTEVKLQVTASWKSTPVLTLAPLTVTLPVVEAPLPTRLELFEDGDDFTAALTEGAGKAALEAKDFYSGKESVQVLAGVKSRAALPGLGVNIAENPQPGEFRYLRFAWKKKGPGSIGLQLAAANQLTAAGVKGTGYRYVAGMDKVNPKAVQVAEQAPAAWTVVTRDLFADHGAFNLTGLALVGGEGEALFDHIFLARGMNDFAPLPK